MNGKKKQTKKQKREKKKRTIFIICMYNITLLFKSKIRLAVFDRGVMVFFPYNK